MPHALADLPSGTSFASPPSGRRASSMFYDAYQGMADIHDRIRRSADTAHGILQDWSANPFAPPWRRMAAYYELVALAGFTHARPDFGIDSVETRGETVPVEEKGVKWTPFCQLLRFRREGGEDDPKILLVAPMSGHFATLLRGTVRTLLARPSGVPHRLDQPAQHKTRTRQFHARGLHPAPDRFRRLHRRGLPRRRGLPADGLGARRLRRAGAGPLERAAREPHSGGGADRRPRRADQGQRARAGEPDRMVPRQHDRRRAGQVRGRGAAGLSRASCSSAPS